MLSTQQHECQLLVFFFAWKGTDEQLRKWTSYNYPLKNNEMKMSEWSGLKKEWQDQAYALSSVTFSILKRPADPKISFTHCLCCWH